MKGEMNMVFEKVPKQNGYTLRNQEETLKNFGADEITDYLEDVFDTPDQFLVLTSPEAQNKVRYVQTSYNGYDNEQDKVEVELGVDEEDGTHLIYKMCSMKECADIFIHFFQNEFEPKWDEYKPVQF